MNNNKHDAGNDGKNYNIKIKNYKKNKLKT